MSAGARFREALDAEQPLLLPGAINPIMAMIAHEAGFRALYLSGSGVATASYGLPDLGMTTLDEVVEDVRRITRVVDAPLIVDADTGFGSELNVERTIRELIANGAAGCHIEDQEGAKRCGHRPNKRIVPCAEMARRIAVASRARGGDGFFLIARTDAFAQEGLEKTIDRAKACLDAGADAIFPEALTSLGDYEALARRINAPILANITEFGRTPLLTARELGGAGVRIVLYPLTIFRMVLAAARDGYAALRDKGTQKDLLPRMMTREDYYKIINYHEYERRLDAPPPPDNKGA
ncbi:methylisocitrate lyase [Candidatus Sumerlaeota bacterium]|nr:methylisocitrate lyase [Candidatus Sumerlaeota bacterium]